MVFFWQSDCDEDSEYQPAVPPPGPANRSNASTTRIMITIKPQIGTLFFKPTETRSRPPPGLQADREYVYSRLHAKLNSAEPSSGQPVKS